MNNWIELERIEKILDPNHFIFLWIVLPFIYLFYRSALRKISEKRHNNLKRRFKVSFFLLLINTMLGLFLWQKTLFFQESAMGDLVARYVGLICLFGSAVTLIRFAQIFVYLYLFFRNMAQGVPRLIANIFTIVFSLLVFGLIGSYVFSIHFSTLLTTSAIFSVVLGFALQDTLGNLFSGITFQLDQPFKIGDWVEIHGDSQKWLGQIHEITWRATSIMTYSNELVMIPNKTVSQSKVILFSHAPRAVRLSHIFHFPLDTDVEKAKQALYHAALETIGVVDDPPPRPLLTEAGESFLVIKVFYSIDDLGLRYRIGDQVLVRALAAIKEQGLVLAVPSLNVSVGDSKALSN